MKRIIKKIFIFDFDGTLVHTALPEDGKLHYKRVTGKEWPHIGWWSKPESLDMEIFETPLVDEVKIAYDAVKDDESVLKIMLTGRRKSLSSHVEKILKHYGFNFDRYIYNTGGDTLTSKIRSLRDVINEFTYEEFKAIEEIEIFEDRVEHVSVFEDWCSNSLIPIYKVNLVTSNRY